MKFQALLYHDVVEDGDEASSGFPGADADIYKLERREFESHLSAIAASGLKPINVSLALEKGNGSSVLLTFDDGGASALHPTADLLGSHGWTGHFFITSNFIGQQGFLSAEAIRSLRRQGHVIGSHSCSHPPRFAKCPPAQMRNEWAESCARLADILGEAVVVASVPGGYYSRAAAEAAAMAGIRVLFNSEPVSSASFVDGCAVIGRYSIQRGTPASTAAALAEGAFSPRARQFAYWNLKKAAKAMGGNQWLRVRKYLLERGAGDGIEGGRK